MDHEDMTVGGFFIFALAIAVGVFLAGGIAFAFHKIFGWGPQTKAPVTTAQ